MRYTPFVAPRLIARPVPVHDAFYVQNKENLESLSELKRNMILHPNWLNVLGKLYDFVRNKSTTNNRHVTHRLLGTLPWVLDEMHSAGLISKLHYQNKFYTISDRGARIYELNYWYEQWLNNGKVEMAQIRADKSAYVSPYTDPELKRPVVRRFIEEPSAPKQRRSPRQFVEGQAYEPGHRAPRKFNPD